MKSTTQFIIIKDSDLSSNMPAHFTQRYGVMNPETERMNMRNWAELIADPAYMMDMGATPQISIEGEICHVVALKLSAIEGDFAYDAAFKYGIDKEAPIGQVCNLEEAEQLITNYQITE